MNDTICAVATAVGESSINVIRISGEDSIKIVNSIFDKDLTSKGTHTITYGHIVNNDEMIDEVLISLFIAPKTFTREDIVEINSHGGIICVNKIIELLLTHGCRLAQPGEFLKRAFLNGRIDLTEAEAVGDIISSKTEYARKNAIKGMNKQLNITVNSMRESIVKLLGNIEVNIDYPEYEDAEIITKEKIHDVLFNIYNKIEKLVDDSDKGILIKNGLEVAIVGKPNSGKSSLLNALIDKDKAIVTNIKGTTRDVVEDSIIIDGILINFYDTAGIRKSNNLVEQIGIKKSIDIIKKADLILFVIDSGSIFNHEDKEILKKLKDKKVLIVYNKTDLKKIKIEELHKYDYIEVSAINKQNINKLKEKISNIFKFNEMGNNESLYVSNARQIALLKKCKEIGKNIEKSIKNDLPIDMIEIDVKELWDTLGEITGETYKEELLDEIFSRFCLGK